MGENHNINRNIYEQALRQKGLRQVDLAEILGEPQQTLSRWINHGYPADKVRSFARALDIKADNFRLLIGAPVYRTFFRKKYNGSPSESSANRAIELAKFWFHWADFPADAVAFPNLSNEKLPATVANSIRGLLKLSMPVTFEGLCLALQVNGVVVVPLSFSYFGLKEESGKDNQECAVTVFDNVSKYVILLDTDANAALLIFNLFHELTHIFRPDAEQGKDEETFCNKTASEVQYPTSKLKEILEKNLKKSAIEKLKAIHSRVGGSMYGITLALKERKLLSPTQIKYLWRVARIGEAVPEDCKPMSRELDHLKDFFNKLKPTAPGAKPYTDFRMAAIEGQLSGRKLAEYLVIDSHLGIVLVDVWNSEVNQDNESKIDNLE